MSQPHSFQPLEVPLMAFNKNSNEAQRSYRVYSSPEEFVTIEAGAAFEAIEKSGIKHPMKVLCDPQLVHCIFDEEMLKSNGTELVGGIVDPGLVAAASTPAAAQDGKDDLIIVTEEAQSEEHDAHEEGGDFSPSETADSESEDGASLS